MKNRYPGEGKPALRDSSKIAVPLPSHEPRKISGSDARKPLQCLRFRGVVAVLTHIRSPFFVNEYAFALIYPFPYAKNVFVFVGRCIFVYDSAIKKLCAGIAMTDKKILPKCKRFPQRPIGPFHPVTCSPVKTKKKAASQRSARLRGGLFPYVFLDAFLSPKSPF